MGQNDKLAPIDAKIISLILRSLGIEECEPKVIIQILEFAYKYSTGVMEDAQLYAEYCGRDRISTADIKLALQTKVGRHFVPPPPKQFMSEIANSVNSKPLMSADNENLLRVPSSKKALFNLDYELLEIDKKKK
ncbi:Transcription initiation factor TFIID subunit 9 [Astathelohania contejeani]|uniref:Transcription initiation factor TFIID subunit 9 n=1 Tax=Astathelohania contejeani TaxID=164912 RepID=A0ABQ7I1U7_9MICR|nr:Transcription initiation factor TFIID subunit 9 [Thelohania contejeani]